jgi:hypothetical protein
MPAKKPRASKPKNYAKLSQKQKFIAAAKSAEADESGETFDRAVDELLRPKRQQQGREIP